MPNQWLSSWNDRKHVFRTQPNYHARDWMRVTSLWRHLNKIGRDILHRIRTIGLYGDGLEVHNIIKRDLHRKNHVLQLIHHTDLVHDIKRRGHNEDSHHLWCKCNDRYGSCHRTDVHILESRARTNRHSSRCDFNVEPVPDDATGSIITVTPKTVQLLLVALLLIQFFGLWMF
jgi:hypothetical protein